MGALAIYVTEARAVGAGLGGWGANQLTVSQPEGHIDRNILEDSY